MKSRTGFTLVEILIVVVILGILAAIVIPQFTSASTEAKESSLVSDLQAVRSQIELFKIQHNDQLPGTIPAGAAVSFVTAMTTKTDQYGAANGRFGPYMNSIPGNPFVDATTASPTKPYDVDEEAGTGSVGGGNCGWHYDTSTGWFQADDDGVNTLDNNKAHSAY
jgi:general secretion pathway protein G